MSETEPTLLEIRDELRDLHAKVARIEAAAIHPGQDTIAKQIAAIRVWLVKMNERLAGQVVPMDPESEMGVKVERSDIARAGLVVPGH